MAVFENIDRLKSQYTDKYVIVAVDRPELKRFHGLTGTVKTVNMSGRALVEFDGNNNIGWFDIDPVFLKVIDQPLPKPEEKSKKEAKPAAKAEKAAPAKAAPEKAAAKPAAAAGGAKSVADILAAARTGAKPATAKAEAPAAEAKAAAPAAKAAVDPKKMSMADILAAARGGAKAAPKAEAATEAAPAKSGEKKSTAELMEAGRVKPADAGVPPLGGPKNPPEGGTPTAKVDPSKMSVADILAAARGKGGAPAAKPAAPPKSEPVAEAAPEPVAEAPAEEAPAAAATAGGAKSMKDAFKTVAEIVAYCRKVDTK
jgi:hypothetical protein